MLLVNRDNDDEASEPPGAKENDNTNDRLDGTKDRNDLGEDEMRWNRPTYSSAARSSS